VRVNPDESVLEVEAYEIGLNMPGLGQIVGLPLEGKLEVKLDVTAPKGLMPQAAGSVTLVCEGCALGDGKTKVAVPGIRCSRRASPCRTSRWAA